MKRYIVKDVYSPSTEEIEDICNSMYNSSYRLVSTIYDDGILYMIFELDEVERRCN